MNFNPHQFDPNRFSRRQPERLGEILLKHTSLKVEQLEAALSEQKEKGGLLGEILLRNNFILPHEIMKALCIQLGMQFVDDLKANDIDANLINTLPINYAKTKEVVPLYKTQEGDFEVLTVAVSDPFNSTIAEDLQALMGMKIKVAVSTSIRIQDAINRVYERSTSKIVGDIEGDFAEADYDLEGPIDILEATEDDAPVIKFGKSP